MPATLDKFWKTNLETLNEEELWDHYKRCLMRHDWTFEYSDDFDVLSVGQEQAYHLREVRNAAAVFNEGRAMKMYIENCPYLNDDGTERTE